MTAIVLPDVDFEELRKRLPSLSEIELPSMQQAGRKADETIDRVLGRSKAPIWPWIAGAIFVAVIGSLVAMFGWGRRSTFTDDTDQGPMGDVPTGLTAAEGSLMSNPVGDL